MDILGRYYTENIISNVLIQGIDVLNPKTVIDLGIGTGSLTNAAFRKWKKAKFLATDIDKRQIKKTGSTFPFIKIIEACGLEKDLDKKLKIKVGSVDVAICNPPYRRIKSRQRRFRKLFNAVGLERCNDLKYLTTDLVFLAQNLLLLKTGGELGIILPDGLITGHEFKLFRQDLVENHTLKSVIQLPDKIFKNTEAKTYILIIKKGRLRSTTTSLILTDKKGKKVKTLKMKSSNLIDRMDFNYHKWRASAPTTCLNLKEIGAVISRGSFSHKEAKQLKIPYFHTTHFNSKKNFPFEKIDFGMTNKIIAQKHDILIARVGKRCIGKIGKITKGNIVLTDCVYRLRVPKKYYTRVWRTLNSNYGRQWFKSHSHGVCSQVISKTDLLNLALNVK